MLIDMISLEEFAVGDVVEMRRVIQMAMDNEIVHEIHEGELFVASLSGELVLKTREPSRKSTSSKRQMTLSVLGHLLDTGEGLSTTEIQTLPAYLDDGISMESYVDGLGEMYTRNAYDGRLRTDMGTEWDK